MSAMPSRDTQFVCQRKPVCLCSRAEHDCMCQTVEIDIDTGERIR